MAARKLMGFVLCIGILADVFGASAAAPRSPMEWASVHTNAIVRWKAENHAPDGVVVDAAAHRVRLLVEATGLDPVDTIEFFAIGPLSDRAYESFFVTVASPAAIAAAIERAGVPRGVPTNPGAARLWPVGEKLTLTAREVPIRNDQAQNAKELSFSDLLVDTRAKEEDDALRRPFLYTGGARDGSGAVVASTNIPCAVFALYTHAPSLLLMNGQFDQSTNYGRFRAKKVWPAGTLFELTLAWDGRITVLQRDVTLTKANVAEALPALRKDADAHDLFVRLAFGADVTVGDAEDLATALAMVDGKGLKVNGAMDGQFFFRAFLPDVSWRERKNRIFQPFEVHLAADGAKTFTFVEEDWSGEGLDPVLRPKETPFKDWSELPGLIAKTGEAGEKINVLFLFAPKSMLVSALTPALPAVKSRIGTFYVFSE